MEFNTNVSFDTIGKVHGTIMDINNIPIKNAIVKIMTGDYQPLMHMYTDDVGAYSFESLSIEKEYLIFSLIDGMKLNQKNVTLTQEVYNVNLDFILEQDTNYNLGLIIGSVVNDSLNQPIKNAELLLSNGSDLETTLYTNESGRCIFPDIPKGSYSLKVKSQGYYDKDLQVDVSNDKEISFLNIKLELISNQETGVISGVITDENNIGIINCDVVLYIVQNNGELLPINFTKTNESGVYMFINVPIGVYKIEANGMEKIILND